MVGIIAKLTDKDVGITILGKQEQLELLYDSIYIILNDEDESEDEAILFLLGLVYELRKAYSGLRAEHCINGVTSYSVNVVLPILLIQIHILNKHLKLYSGENQTSIATVQDFIQQVLHAIGERSESTQRTVESWLKTTAPLSDRYLFAMVYHYSAKYIAYHPSEARLGSLGMTLQLLDESQLPHKAMRQALWEQAKIMNCHPENLEFKDDLLIFENLDQGKTSW
jgi:hypothetical protein